MQSIGNLAQHFLLRKQNSQMQSELSKLSEEVASGLSADVGRQVKGDYSGLADLQHTMKRLESYNLIANETRLILDAAQTTTQHVNDLGSQLRGSLAKISLSSSDVAISAVTEEADQAFKSAVSALDIHVAGKTVFGGTNFSQDVLLAADEMLSNISADLVGVTTPNEYLERINQWFMEPGGGYENTGYLGSDQSMSSVQVGKNVSVELSLTADDNVFRAALRDLAAVSLVGNADLALSQSDQRAIMQGVSDQLPNTLESLISAQAILGGTQSRLDQAVAANSAGRGATEIAISDLVSVDPYETAVRFENVSSQIESLYLITSRLNRLSLMDYLR